MGSWQRIMLFMSSFPSTSQHFSSLPHIYPALKISRKEAFAKSGWRPGLILGCPELVVRVFKRVYYGIVII